jgi:putative ABC transport system permease protein
LINRLVFENLKHRRLRTVLSALSVGFQVLMILTVVGLSRGMLQDSVNRARGVNAEVWVKPPGATAISFSTAGMPQKMLDYFARQPHAVRVSGTVVQPIGGINTISGIDLAEFSAVSGGFKFLQGGPFQGPDDLIVDDWYARSVNKTVGDTVQILNRDWRICGIVEPGKLARLFVQRSRLQELTGNTGKLSQVFIKLDDPANTTQVIARLKEELPDYSIWSIDEFASLFSVGNVPALRGFIAVIIGLSVIIGFLVVSITMYTTVLERTREIGILKALGASPMNIMNILMREAILLTIAGWLIGLVLAWGATELINGTIRASLQSVIVPDWWPIVGAIALGASLLGSIYPGMRAARQDAIEALAYE